jgi:hypothetical protein
MPRDGPKCPHLPSFLAIICDRSRPPHGDVRRVHRTINRIAASHGLRPGGVPTARERRAQRGVPLPRGFRFAGGERGQPTPIDPRIAIVIATRLEQEAGGRKISREAAVQHHLFVHRRHSGPTIERVGNAIPVQGLEIHRLQGLSVADLNGIVPALRQPRQESIEDRNKFTPAFPIAMPAFSVSLGECITLKPL